MRVNYQTSRKSGFQNIDFAKIRDKTGNINIVSLEKIMNEND